MRTARLHLLILVMAVAVHGSRAVADGSDPYAQVSAGNLSYADEEYSKALEHYVAASEKLGDRAELIYNQAAAQYKLEDYEEASKLFAEAALSEDASVRSRSLFGWGNCDYAEALRGIKPQASEGQEPPDLNTAVERLESAIEHYRDAITAGRQAEAPSPVGETARQNIERAQRLVDQIRMQQQQQQQNDQQQNDQQQNDQQQDEQQQNQQQQNGQQQDQQEQQEEEQKGEQGSQSESAQQKEQQGSESQQDQQDQEDKEEQQPEQQQGEEKPHEQEPQPQQEQKEEDQQQGPQELSEPQNKPSDAQQGQPLERRELSPDEVEALLQAVRERESERRRQRLQRMEDQRVPVEEDW